MTNIADTRWLALSALALVVTCNVAGNLLLKLGADTASQKADPTGFLNWQFVAGVSCFAFGIIAYSWALQKLHLHLAQIVVSMQYALVILLAWLFLGEKIEPAQWIGITFITFGIFLCLRGQP